MKTSPVSKVLELYEDSADWYAKLMDSEIDLPVYADTLSRLAERIATLQGPVLDTSCGSGHMLAKYRALYDPNRPLIGVDLAPSMVTIARAKLGSDAEIFTGDMRNLEGIESKSVAAVLSFFAIHHLDPGEVLPVLQEWHRILAPGGQIVIAAWEGSGPIDYGGESDVVALRYTADEVSSWTTGAGFFVDRCVVEAVDGMPTDAIYLEGGTE